MRTLLVDNYDSYTYNLFQLIADVNGAEPTVLRNDDPRLWQADLARFDNVVISPGPGRPDRTRDFGGSARVIAESPVPVLGVCLGHQGIAALTGGTVRPAPKARHGYLTKVRHDGGGLFQGLPQEFLAVRYHSLAVAEPLPPHLEASAWAEDGVLMALRHRARPLWGVQFHPESIASEHGATLLDNFRRLTIERAPERLPEPLPHQARRRVPVQQNYRLHVRTIDREVDTETAFAALFADSPRAFWLDSARVEKGLSRFSFLGDGSGPLSELVTYRVDDGKVTVSGPGQVKRREAGSIFDYLQRELGRRRFDCPALPFDFATGYVGWFGYELKADCGSPNRHTVATPSAAWLFADRLLVVDHAERHTYLLALSGLGPDSADGAICWLDETAARLAEVPGTVQPARRLSNGPLDDSALAPYLLRDREQYLDDVQACRAQLLAGESYEICLTNTVRIDRSGEKESGLGFYRRLRRQNPAPYAAFLRLAGLEVACSSPERFLKIDKIGTVETKPIKGTVRRGWTPEEDAELRDSLGTSEKTFAENLMIVDLLRNDLGRVCEVGSVYVPKLMAVESYATVHQLVSTIRGTLRPDADAIECVRACFPGGSMTGAPKLRTMEIIDGLETEARGVYSGAIGFLGLDGTADLNIVIRTAVLTDTEWQVGAGGAIVLDSDPVEEYQEMVLKAMASLQAHPIFGPPEREL